MLAGPCDGNRPKGRARAARSSLCRSLWPRICGLHIPPLDFVACPPGSLPPCACLTSSRVHRHHPTQYKQVLRAGLWQVPGTEEVRGDVC